MEKEITKENELGLKKIIYDTCPQFVEWASENIHSDLIEFKSVLFDKFKKYCNDPYIDKHMSTNMFSRWVTKYCEFRNFDFNTNYGSGGLKIMIKGCIKNFGEVVSISKGVSCLFCKYHESPKFSPVCSFCLKNNKVNEYYK